MLDATANRLCFFASTIALAAASLVSAGSSNGDQPDPNLIVQTRTGTFVGDYNDTYPDVRQFKFIPYAKVCVPKASSTGGPRRTRPRTV